MAANIQCRRWKSTSYRSHTRTSSNASTPPPYHYCALPLLRVWNCNLRRNPASNSNIMGFCFLIMSSVFSAMGFCRERESLAFTRGNLVNRVSGLSVFTSGWFAKGRETGHTSSPPLIRSICTVILSKALMVTALSHFCIDWSA